MYCPSRNKLSKTQHLLCLASSLYFPREKIKVYSYTVQPVTVLYEMLYEQERKPYVSQNTHINQVQSLNFFTVPQNPHSTKIQGACQVN